jgi:hypothetical protein
MAPGKFCLKGHIIRDFQRIITYLPLIIVLCRHLETVTLIVSLQSLNLTTQVLKYKYYVLRVGLYA